MYGRVATRPRTRAAAQDAIGTTAATTLEPGGVPKVPEERGFPVDRVQAVPQHVPRPDGQEPAGIDFPQVGDEEESVARVHSPFGQEDPFPGMPHAPFLAFVALQRYLAGRVPLRRVRKRECPFCGFPVGENEHCEGCGREVVAECATCSQPRRVGTLHCGACGSVCPAFASCNSGKCE